MTVTSRRRFLLLVGGGSLVGSAALLAACSAPTSTPPAAAPTTAPAAAAQSTAAPAAAATTAPAAAPTAAPAAAPTTAPASTASGDVNLYVGGDVNIRDLWQKQLLPAYQKVKPNVKFTLVFDEHALSEQAVFDKLAAAKQAGATSGVDLWEASRLPQAGDAGLMQKVTSKEVPNLDKVPQDSYNRYNGYGLPYRASSVILAYNSSVVKDAPKTLEDVIAWVKANDGQFTYNPPDKGGSGGSFVTRVLSIGIPSDQLTAFQTQYDESKESMWDAGWQVLKDLHPHIYNGGFYPQGNVPVLQTLGNGSIAMAPVWSDQSLSYLSQKLLPPEVMLEQIDPPFAGSAAYLGIPADSKNKEVLYEFLNWLLTPEPQAVIVSQINGYPGLDWKYMPPEVQAKYADIAKAYSFDFSPQYGTDRNKQWYEKVAGTPQPSA